MSVFNKLFFLSFSFFILIACKPEEPEVCPPSSDYLRITVQPTFGSETLFLDSIYQTPEGYDVKFKEIKFYIEDIRNGVNLLSDVALFDYRLRGDTLMQSPGDKVFYEGIQANLGVGPSLNHNDPVGFDPNSWLYISNSNDMHWDWNPGYIFVKIEAKVDTIQDGIALFDHNVIFHVGKDENLKNLSFDNINWVNIGDEHIFSLKLDLLHFLDTGSSSIDLKTEYTSHTSSGQEVLSEKIMTNFKESLTPF